METSYSFIKPNPHISNIYFNPRSIALITIGAISVIGGLFILLAAGQVLPQGVNAISTWRVGGYAVGVSLIGVGIPLMLLGRCWDCKNTSPNAETLHPIVSNTTQTTLIQQRAFHSFIIREDEFQQFSTYHCAEPDHAYAHAVNTCFFYGNCDEEEDLGWGCAWRSIQICISALNRFLPFRDLYNQYRLTNGAQEWAEPGYGKRYLDDVGIPSQLILYKRNKGTNKTPTDQCKNMTNFSDLRNQMVEHFKTYSIPIMADDEMYAYAIIGIRITQQDETILFVADPHKTDYASGLYYVVLDKDGKQIATTGIDNGLNGLRTVCYMFFTKGWILLFPQPVRHRHDPH